MYVREIALSKFKVVPARACACMRSLREKKRRWGSLASKNHFRHAPRPLSDREWGQGSHRIFQTPPFPHLFNQMPTRHHHHYRHRNVFFLLYFFDVEAWRVFRLHKTTLVISSIAEHRVCLDPFPLKILHTQSENDKNGKKGQKLCATN